MEENISLREWSKRAGEYHAVEWDRLPELELYMDQVIGYLNRQLSVLRGEGEESTVLTNSMVNNYVKDGLIDRPVQKKYQREQLCGLTEICALKSVLAIPDIARLLGAMKQDRSVQELYGQFSAIEESVLHEVAARVADCGTIERAAADLALQLALEADARVLAAQRLIALLKQPEEAKEDKKEHKEEKKEHKKEK